MYKDESNLFNTRKISLFEYCRCFGSKEDVLCKVAENNRNLELLRDAMPANTSSFLLEKACNLLQQVVLDHEKFAVEQHPDIAPAAVSNVLTNGIIHSKRDSHNYSVNIVKCQSYCINKKKNMVIPTYWRYLCNNYANLVCCVHHKISYDDACRQAIQKDDECQLILKMLENPALISQGNLNKIHYTLRQPLQDSNMFEKNYSKNISIALKLVPTVVRNIIFLAFHSNPLGGHLSVYHTIHRIRLRFYWPLMVKYMQNIIQRCPGYKMANSTINTKQNYLYPFPIDAPFCTIHIDIYTLGKT